MSEKKSSPLSSIDENLIRACTFLEDFGDDRKLDCLQTFVNCADITEWIRTYTKGMSKYFMQTTSRLPVERAMNHKTNSGLP